MTTNPTDLIEPMLATIVRHQKRNARKWDYYRTHRKMIDLGIALPPGLPDKIKAVVGWPGTIVDVLDERLEWRGWTTHRGRDTYELTPVARENYLGALSPHIDSLVTGVAFAVVGKGDKGEPETLITLESSDRATVVADPRTMRPAAGLVVTGYDRDPEAMKKVDRHLEQITGRGSQARSSATAVTVHTRTGRFMYERAGVDRPWNVVDEVPHKHGIPLMTRWPNRPAVQFPNGRSEITRPIIYYTQHAMRSLAGAEVTREMFATPGRWISGLGADDLEKASDWQQYMGKVLALTASDEGVDDVKVGQFAATSPAPFYDSTERLANLTAAEGAIPVTYLGEQTANPHSAEARRVAEVRTDRRTVRRQRGYDLGYAALGAAVLAVREGQVPSDYWAQIASDWDDARIPTPAADADAAAKIVGSGIVPADSAVARRRAGLTPDEIDSLATNDATARGWERLEAIRTAADAARARPEIPEALDRRGDATDADVPDATT